MGDLKKDLRAARLQFWVNIVTGLMNAEDPDTTSVFAYAPEFWNAKTKTMIANKIIDITKQSIKAMKQGIEAPGA